jgi:protease PrsW
VSVVENSGSESQSSASAAPATAPRTRTFGTLLGRFRDDSPEARDRRRIAKAGLPQTVDPSEPLPKRILTNRLFWLSVAMLIVYAVLLVLLYNQVVPDRRVPGGQLIGLGHEAIPISAKYAAFTAVPLALVFLWVDRFRPQRLPVWFMAFGWGACVATFVAAQVNTWAAGHLSIIGNGDPATGSRAAIYVAPFVEEACKATVLFWLAILMRYRWVSRLTGIALAGLSAAGFAFVENILYYGRVYRYAANTFGTIQPEQALQQLFFLRGVLTFFGHPLFTSMTGIGLAIALRSKSKIVRVVAPLAGYCAAAFLHMTFNTVSTFVSGTQLLLMYVFMALPAVIAMISFVVRQEFREGRLIQERLTDYVRVGWLPESDVRPMSRLRTRLRSIWQSVFLGLDAFVATIKVQRAETELAYLRDAVTRGVVDDAGLLREKTLLAIIRTERGQAVIQPARRAAYERIAEAFGRGRKTTPSYAPAHYPGPAGLGGNLPAPGTAPIGPAATHYSEVNPNWKPPGE